MCSRVSNASAVHLESGQKALVKNEGLYRRLFNGLNDAVFVHTISPEGVPGLFIEVNDTACQRLGYSRDELLNLGPMDIDAPEILPGLGPVIAKLLDQGKILFEGLHTGKDGRRIPVEINAFIFTKSDPTVVLSVARDISERKNIQRQIDHLASFPQMNPNPILEIDKNGMILFTNRAMQDLVEQGVIDDARVLVPDDILGRLLKNGSQEKFQDYREIQVGRRVLAVTFDYSPEFGALRAYTIDISARVEMEHALAEERSRLARRVEERTADLSLANAQLARASRMKDEFLASMSHELRTPLSGILGLAEALTRNVYGELNTKQATSIQHIEESGRHLLSLINDILDLSKVESGKLDLEIGPLLIEDVCQASLRMVKQAAQKKNLRICTSFDSSATTMMADSRRLKQILVNLLSNAVKFTPAGGGIGLDVVADAGHSRVCFSVWDTGIGIDQEELDRLFKPFSQLDSRLSRLYTGTGLGLSLVLRMVELHGGGIQVESKPGVGSRFTVTLPWIQVKSVDQATIQRGKLSQLHGDIQPKNNHGRVLVVDDNELALQTLTDILHSVGFDVVVARNGSEAIDVAREARPGVVLMDIQMPVMDGLEATHRIRSDDDLRHLPVVALTALAMSSDRERCLEAGANDYLTKPVDVEHLLGVLDRLLDQGDAV